MCHTWNGKELAKLTPSALSVLSPRGIVLTSWTRQAIPVRACATPTVLRLFRFNAQLSLRPLESPTRNPPLFGGLVFDDDTATEPTVP